MNKFQILNKNGEPIAINALDAEVCEIIGNDIHPKHYCVLGKRRDFPKGTRGEFEFLSQTSNWHDTFGWMIAEENKSFQDMIEYYTDAMKDFLGEPDANGVPMTIEMIYPYHMKVLKTWIAKDYTPKQILT